MRIVFPLVLLAGLGAALLLARFRRVISARHTALRMVSRLVETPAGRIEYAGSGRGFPVLAIHGAGGGHDQGMSIARSLFGPGYRLIAPSRFGYLRTPAPIDPTPARQAEAHRALLDTLGIQRAVVLAASAGAPSAIELALSHPDGVAALILLVPFAYEPNRVMGVSDDARSRLVLRAIEAGADFAFWLAGGLARRWVVRFLGVPPALEASAAPAERARVTAMIRDLLPLSDRIAGLAIDGHCVLEPWPLEKMRVPVLIFTTCDDLFHSLPGATYTAQGIPGAELHVLDTGGHLLVGQGGTLLSVTADFLARRAPEAAPSGGPGVADRERPLERGEHGVAGSGIGQRGEPIVERGA